MTVNSKDAPAWKTNTTDGPIIVTGREYQTVLDGLRLPNYYFEPGKRVLSIGEGLSNFARHLHDERGVDIIAVDPIYALGNAVLQHDPYAVKETIERKYGKHVELMDTLRTFPLPDSQRIGAASIYHLPFEHASIDYITSFRLFEHINFERALPELLRVLKPGGEIRMFGLHINIFPEQSVLLETVLEAESNFEIYRTPNPGMANSLELPEMDDISTFVHIGSHPRAKIGRHYPNMRIANMIIIRNDQNWPEVATNGSSSNDNIDMIAKVLPRTKHRDDESGQVAHRIEIRS